MRYSEEPYPALARAWQPHSKSARRRKRPPRSGASGAHPTAPPGCRAAAGPPRRIPHRSKSPPHTSHWIRLTYSAALKSAPGTQKQKIGPNCNFFAIADCREAPNRGSRSKNAANRPFWRLISTLWGRKSVRNRKKVAKEGRFLFLQSELP